MSPYTLALFLDELRTRIEDYLYAAVSDHLTQAHQDADAFLAAVRGDLERWVAALARGDLSTDEFRSLVRGQLALCKLEALEQAGLAKIRLDQIRAGILDLVLDAAFDFLP